MCTAVVDNHNNNNNNNNNNTIYIVPFPRVQWRFTIIVILKRKCIHGFKIGYKLYTVIYFELLKRKYICNNKRIK